jgi:hypothetical protein
VAILLARESCGKGRSQKPSSNTASYSYTPPTDNIKNNSVIETHPTYKIPDYDGVVAHAARKAAAVGGCLIHCTSVFLCLEAPARHINPAMRLYYFYPAVHRRCCCSSSRCSLDREKEFLAFKIAIQAKMPHSPIGVIRKYVLHLSLLAISHSVL